MLSQTGVFRCVSDLLLTPEHHAHTRSNSVPPLSLSQLSFSFNWYLFCKEFARINEMHITASIRISRYTEDLNVIAGLIWLKWESGAWLSGGLARRSERRACPFPSPSGPRLVTSPRCRSLATRKPATALPGVRVIPFYFLYHFPLLLSSPLPPASEKASIYAPFESKRIKRRRRAFVLTQRIPGNRGTTLEQ